MNENDHLEILTTIQVRICAGNLNSVPNLVCFDYKLII